MTIKIPKKEEYEEFLGSFTHGLSKNFPEICFFTYGSIDGECNCGLSDIDGGLIFNSGIITDKNKIIRLSELFSNSMGDKEIKTQFNILDKQSSEEGRFLSYSNDYTDWIKERGKVLSGPNLLKYLNGRDYKSQVLHTAAFNFSGPGGMRKSLFYVKEDLKKGEEQFIKTVLRAIDKVIKYPKKIIWLKEGKVIEEEMKAIENLEEMLSLDLTQLKIFHESTKDVRKLYKGLKEDKKGIYLISQSLETMEMIIDRYIKRFPEITEREMKR